VIGESMPTYSWNAGTDAVDFQLLLFDGSGSLILNAWSSTLSFTVTAAGSVELVRP